MSRSLEKRSRTTVAAFEVLPEFLEDVPESPGKFGTSQPALLDGVGTSQSPTPKDSASATRKLLTDVAKRAKVETKHKDCSICGCSSGGRVPVAAALEFKAPWKESLIMTITTDDGKQAIIITMRLAPQLSIVLVDRTS